MDTSLYRYAANYSAEKRYQPTYKDGQYQGHKLTTDAKQIGTEVSDYGLEELRTKQKLEAYIEKIGALQDKFEQSCAQGLQHRKERDEHFQNFREACRVGLKHRKERNDVTRALSKVMKENERLKGHNTDLQDRVDGLFKALHHKPFDEDLLSRADSSPKGTRVYLYLTIVASAVASVPILQAILVAATGSGIF